MKYNNAIRTNEEGRGIGALSKKEINPQKPKISRRNGLAVMAYDRRTATNGKLESLLTRLTRSILITVRVEKKTTERKFITYLRKKTEIIKINNSSCNQSHFVTL